MAALCPGVQYGLSSQESFGENKDLIFVKLTDSAFRAIEEYLKNKNKFSCPTPTIKFLGHEGQIAFPSPQNGSTSSFKFSMSSTQDMEGPGGSFECVQQTGPPRGGLGSLGSIPYKIRIHANEDIYAATRQRMTVAEENHKNKCTREIKPNQTDIGRKVKVKQNRTQLTPSRKESPTTMREILLKSSPYSSSSPSKPVVSLPSNGLSNGLSSNHVSSSRPHQNKPSVPDISRRPIKERLIQLLALKPFKKVELHERLMKEGHRERNGMAHVLKQVAVMKDNCYYLNRSLWNDVHEDWPFYTESEKQILKRRKPQNLTPPGSTDSGSSGQSPTSTHPGSPPPITTSSSKRPGYYDGVDGFPTKRPRVSHFRKPSDQSNTSPIAVENNTPRKPITDSRDASNMNPRSREVPITNGHIPAHAVIPPLDVRFGEPQLTNDKRHIPSEYDDHLHGGTKKRSCDSQMNGLEVGVNRGVDVMVNSSMNGRKGSPMKSPREDIQRKDELEWQNGFTNGDVYNGHNFKTDIKEVARRKYNNNVSSSTPNGVSRVSPDSQTDPIMLIDADHETENISPPPDYYREYAPITNAAQRKRYKNDFTEHYAEYKDLHGRVEKVSRRFAELEERLKQEDKNSPRYKDIKKQIVREYQENKQNKDHQKLKARFHYLHDKLSHIKKLVCEYDQLSTRTFDSEY